MGVERPSPLVNIPLSSFAEVAWPAIPAPYSAGILAVLFQLEQSQWWSADDLRRQQFAQLRRLLLHAKNHVPCYQDRLAGFDTAADAQAVAQLWPDVPLLSRRDVQLAGAELHATSVPRTHGAITRTATGGSTGQPVIVQATGLTDFFWRVLTIRDHLWHQRDWMQPFAAIRYTGDTQGKPPLGTQIDSWGPATQNVIRTGSGFLLNVQSTIEEQATWLRHVNPGYLLAYPSALRAIADLFRERGWSLPHLKQLRTYGEILELDCRTVCREVFGVEIADMYSSQEVGYMALQCPHHLHYHVQAETAYVEVLDSAGRACRPGEVGRVVVTPLHNFAMPLVRYDIGDYAEVGPPCPCGRGLPVLKRILGRQRNLLRLPTGERKWPLFDQGHRPEELPPFFQFQVVQRTLDVIDVKVVCPRPFTLEEEASVQRYFQQTLGYPFTIELHCVDEIPRSPTGKYEDFMSLIDQD